jgi:hypothetical protein
VFRILERRKERPCFSEIIGTPPLGITKSSALLDLKIDSGGVQVRRIIERELAHPAKA